MIYAIIILSILLLISIWVILNLLKKYEKVEDMVLERNKLIDNFKETVSFIDAELNKIDDKGTFKSDDEIGFFFEKIQFLQKILNSYFKS